MRARRVHRPACQMRQEECLWVERPVARPGSCGGAVLCSGGCQPRMTTAATLHSPASPHCLRDPHPSETSGVRRGDGGCGGGAGPEARLPNIGGGTKARGGRCCVRRAAAHGWLRAGKGPALTTGARRLLEERFFGQSPTQGQQVAFPDSRDAWGTFKVGANPNLLAMEGGKHHLLTLKGRC